MAISKSRSFMQQSAQRWPGPGSTARKIAMMGRVCETGKECFETLQAAQVKAEQMMECGFVDPGCHITPFACPHCHAFHVGNRKIIFRDEL